MRLKRRFERFKTSWKMSRERRFTVRATQDNGFVRGNYYWAPLDQTRRLPRERLVSAFWRGFKAMWWVA